MKNTLKIKKNYEFNSILKKGKYFGGEVLDCFYLKNSKKINYLGIAINSKLFHAVRRNKIKRRIREAYFQIEKEIKTGNTFIFLWKKKASIEEGTYEKILKDMQQIMKKIGLMENEKNNN